MLLRSILLFCILFNSCDRFGDKNKPEVVVKTYTKEEKLKMFDVMLSQFVKNIQKTKNLSSLKDMSDEHGNFTVDCGSYTGEKMLSGKFWKDDLTQLEQNVKIEEILSIIQNEQKEIYENSVSYGYTANGFEYGLDFFFLEKHGKWILRDFSRLRPERG